MNLLFEVFYFMWPVYMANLAPLLFRKINFLDYPVDFGRKLGGKRILGSHKTFRGFFFGTLAGVGTAYLQYILMDNAFFAQASLLDYSNWILIGFLLGFGALLGDSVKSFFKRRAGISPGNAFIPFDEVDYTLGALLSISFIYLPSWQFWAVGLIINFILHVAVNHIAYHIGVKKVKW